jgi:hypothetical protein
MKTVLITILLLLLGPKRGEVIGCWRILHTEKFHKLYPSPSIFRIVKSGHVAPKEEKGNACRILVRKPEVKRPLGRPRCR